MTSALHHLRILASAGSGKTYQLATRYLRLIAGGAPPTAILGSTFTRMAAGEIRARILTRLADAAGDDDERRVLAGALGRASLARAEVLEMLGGLARRMDSMQVRTLDGFFASLVRSFSFELGIPTGCSIVDDDVAGVLRTEAIRRTLAGSDHARLVELLRILTQGNADRAVFRAIDTEVVDLYELHRECTDDAWDFYAVPGTRLADDDLALALARIEALDLNKSQGKARDDDVRRARSGDWKAVLDTGLPRAILQSGGVFNRQDVPPDALDAYRPLIGHASAALVAPMLDRAKATHDLLRRFEVEYEALKRSRRVLTFADLVAVINRAPDLATTDIGYRLDGRIDHVLLDEFQDTSVAQWRALQIIIADLVADETRGRTLFCVGDVKQAIYGFRAGTSELLEELPRLLFGDADTDAIDTESLALSYRSSPVVIRAVNEVFEHLDDAPAFEKHPEVAAAWCDAFDHHEAKHTDRPGFVELRTTPAPVKGESPKFAGVGPAVRLATALHAAHPTRTVGILARTNGVVLRVMAEFERSAPDVPVGGGSDAPLVDVAPVNALLDLFTFADHPDDTIAAYHVAHSPLAAMIDAPENLATKDARPARHRLARKLRTVLADDGYAATVGRWVRHLAPSCDAVERHRLLKLVTLAEVFDETSDLRPAAFARYVEAKPVLDARPAPVQVMTIHRAKGLEFDTVILPDLTWRFDDMHAGRVILASRTELTGRITRICPHSNSAARRLVPELQTMYDDEVRRTVRESLCILYVAMTRAKHALHLIIPPADTDKGGRIKSACTPASLLHSIFAPTATDADTVLARDGDPDWAGPADDGPATDTAEETPVRVPFADDDTPRRARGERAAPASSHVGRGRLAERLTLVDREPTERGRAVHALFEHLTWLDDGLPSDHRARSIITDLLPRRTSGWVGARLTEFRAAIGHESIRSLLTRRGRAIDLLREHPFARVLDGRLERGIIDRVHLERDGSGRVRAARIIDFKTDAVDASTVGDRVDHYRPQLARYREALGAHLGLDVTAIRTTLAFVQPGIVIDPGD